MKRFFTLPEPLRELFPITAGAFVVLTLIGYLAGLLRPESIAPLLGAFEEMIDEKGLTEAAGAELMTGILANNLSALFIAMLLGLIPFIRLPAMELGLNALMLGGMASYYQHSGIPLVAYLVGVLPHGITELTALVLACAGGLHLCRAVSDALLRRGEKGGVARAFGECMQMYMRVIVPLLLLSALIEAFVTPSLLEAVL